MAKVKLTEDLYAPHPSGRSGTFHLVGRKGAMVDERIVKAVQKGKALQDAAAEDNNLVTSNGRKAALQAEAEAEAQDAPAAEGYDAMKVAELRKLADDRGIDHDGMKKAELVEALEDHDES